MDFDADVMVNFVELMIEFDRNSWDLASGQLTYSYGQWP